MPLNILIDQLSSPQIIVEEVKAQIPVTVCNLTNTGYLDYLWYAYDNHSVTLERKTVQDFSGRVDDTERQLKRALGTADEVGLII